MADVANTNQSARFSDAVNPASTAVTDRSRSNPAHPANTAREPTASEFADMSVSDRADYRNDVAERERVAEQGRRLPERVGRRLTAPPEKVDDDTYAKMTLAERARYAWEHTEWNKQNPAGGGDPAGDAPTEDAATVKVGDDLTVSPAEFKEFLAHKAEVESGKLSAPATPADYQAVLPANFVVPEGLGSFAFDESAPELQRFRQLAHSAGLSQEKFSEALGLYAGLQARDAQQFKAARDAEIAKLGAAAGTRIDAVSTWLRAKIGDDLAKHVSGMMVTHRIVAGLEKLMQQSSSQGGSNFSQAHREQGAQEPDDATWNSWSYGQKRAWQAENALGNGRAR